LGLQQDFGKAEFSSGGIMLRPAPGILPGKSRKERTAALSPEDALTRLGLKRGAAADEVRQAYRDLVKVWHPDRSVVKPV